MKTILLAAALVAAVGASSASRAADISARDPQALLDAVVALGYQAELKANADGSPSIGLTIDGSPSSIQFYNCDDAQKNCETLLFAYGMNTDKGVALEKVNEWNANTIHGFVYTDDEADPWLNMVVITGSGIAEDVFAEYMRIWRARIGSVRDFFDF